MYLPYVHLRSLSPAVPAPKGRRNDRRREPMNRMNDRRTELANDGPCLAVSTALWSGLNLPPCFRRLSVTARVSFLPSLNTPVHIIDLEAVGME